MDTTHIKNYILYLKRECGLKISLHVKGFDSVILPGELNNFNIHDNSYCAYIKSSERAHDRCIENQEKVANKCKDGSFCGVCHAGVSEYIYPIVSKDKTVGFISVSGYKCTDADSYIKRVAKKYGLNENQLCTAYDTLSGNIPPKEVVDTLVVPLCNMLELAYIKSDTDDRASSDLINKVVCYIKRYHTKNITTKDICKYFSCSRSLISHKFTEHTGVGIKQYINTLRVESAKNLLENSRLSITEISFSVGYSSANYFTQIFKSITGMSPIAYRQKERKTKKA